MKKTATDVFNERLEAEQRTKRLKDFCKENFIKHGTYIYERQSTRKVKVYYWGFKG